MKRMNKKGFTLIELLGVIVIIILILSLVLPKIVSRVKSKENDIAMINDSIITNAASLYVDKNKDKYPEVNGNKYCIDMADMDEYLGTVIKDYSNNEVTGKEIQVEYNNAYSFNVVEEGMCVEVSTDSSRCETDGLCNVCYVSKTYNSDKDVYLFEPKIIDEIIDKTQSEVENVLGSVYVESIDDCTLLAIMDAAKQYVSDHKSEFKKVNGNIYCLPLSTLVSAGYLNSPINYQNHNIADTHSIEVKVVNGQYQYSLTSKSSCQEVLACGTFMDVSTNLTPVVYDESVSMWRIVSEDDPNWFDYDNQKWANAVILTQSARNSKRVGDTITVDAKTTSLANLDALAMFVWIPRYSYTIKQDYGYQGANAPTPTYTSYGGIDVKCISPDVKDTGTGKYTGNTPSNYRTMPGFTFDGKELKGLWVSKFLASANQIKTSSFTQITCNNNTCAAADNLRFLPNQMVDTKFSVQSSDSVTNSIDGAFYAILSMSRSGNAFSIDSSKYDTHLEKNSEYATVLYLKNSKYGKYGNTKYTNTNKEVYKNNSLELTGGYKLITGRSGGTFNQESNFEGNFYYDHLGDTYSFNSSSLQTNSNCTFNGSSSCTSSYTLGQGANDGTLTVEFTIENGKVGQYNARVDVSGRVIKKLNFDMGCTSVTLFGKTTYSYNEFYPFMMYEMYKDGIPYINDGNFYYHVDTGNSKTFNGILGPGSYRIIFRYSYGSTRYKPNYESVYGTRTGKSSCPSTDALATLSDFSIKTTSTYTDSWTQTNGVGASTTGNVYGVYDLDVPGEFVSAKSSSCSSTLCSSYSKYFDFFGEVGGFNSISTCNGTSCYGQGLEYDFKNLSDGGEWNITSDLGDTNPGYKRFGSSSCANSNCNTYWFERNLYYYSIDNSPSTAFGYRSVLISK